jgi:transaldolase
MNPLDQLHELGQSPWLDNLRRDWIANGELQTWIDNGIRGLTSNPSIFQKAIAGSDLYDEQFRALVNNGESIADAYWKLVTTDIEGALAVLRPVFDSSGGTDGFVSVEVDPSLANETDPTTQAAQELATAIDEPNLMVKIPGTVAGLPSIRQMTAEKVSINVTLIFSVERYRDVMEAYISGLEDAEGDLSGIASVASFLVEVEAHNGR